MRRDGLIIWRLLGLLDTVNFPFPLTLSLSSSLGNTMVLISPQKVNKAKAKTSTHVPVTLTPTNRSVMLSTFGLMSGGSIMGKGLGGGFRVMDIIRR